MTVSFLHSLLGRFFHIRFLKRIEIKCYRVLLTVVVGYVFSLARFFLSDMITFS